MTDFKILSIDEQNKTMIIDWGHVVLNHDIPLYVLENPNISEAEMLEMISYQRPPVPVDLPIPKGLLNLAPKVEEVIPTLEEIKLEQNKLIDTWRVRAEQKGMPYTFPTGDVDNVQLRNERDIANVNGQVSASLVLTSQGVTEPVLFFRAESNTTYSLTPTEMVQLGMAVNQFVGRGYQIAWELKERVALAKTEEEVRLVVWPD